MKLNLVCVYHVNKSSELSICDLSHLICTHATLQTDNANTAGHNASWPCLVHPRLRPVAFCTISDMETGLWFGLPWY